MKEVRIMGACFKLTQTWRLQHVQFTAVLNLGFSTESTYQ